MDIATLGDYLDHLQMFGIKLGLGQTRELMAKAGRPDRALKFIHIAGSNGKGSCGAMLHAALTGAGFKTGFYCSPHLFSLRERIRVGGRAVGEELLCRLADELVPLAEEMKENGDCPTYFEFTTVLAAMVFAHEKVDFAIWETGMGGRFDATNVVEPVAALITGIALDHQKYLGSTLPEIAREKAGIIKGGVPVFAGLMPPEALAVIRAKAGEVKAPLTVAENPPLQVRRAGGMQEFEFHGHAIRLRLAGAMQRRNFLAVAPLLEYLADRYKFNVSKAFAALADARWPGRIDILEDGTVIDGGHNPDGLSALHEALEEIFPDEKFTVIFGNFQDKDTIDGLRRIAPSAGRFIFVPIRSERPSWTPPELGAKLREFSGLPFECAPDVAAALQLARRYPERQVLCGSLYLVGEAFEQLGMIDHMLHLN